MIPKATIYLATSLKNDDNTVTIYGVVPRLDDLNNKANEVSRRLVLMCKEGIFHSFRMMKALILAST